IDVERSTDDVPANNHADDDVFDGCPWRDRDPKVDVGFPVVAPAVGDENVFAGWNVFEYEAPGRVRNRYSAALRVLNVFRITPQVDTNALKRSRLARPYYIALDGAVVQGIGNLRRCLSNQQRDQQQQGFHEISSRVLSRLCRRRPNLFWAALSLY